MAFFSGGIVNVSGPLSHVVPSMLAVACTDSVTPSASTLPETVPVQSPEPTLDDPVTVRCGGREVRVADGASRPSRPMLGSAQL